MKKIRLLPLVLIAVTALLAVKVLGFVMGVEPLAVGPREAVASGGEAPAGHGEAAADTSGAPDTSAVDRLTAPIDLADEYKKLKEEQEKGGGHGEAPAGHGGDTPAAGHGEAPAAHDAAPAEGAAHGETSATDAGHGAPADAGHAAPAEGGHDAAPADAGHAASAEGGHEAAPAADAGHGAPADGGHGAPAEDGHGAKTPTDVYTERPKEYSPPIGSSERAILEGLAVRRDELDKRAHDLDLRAKLLEATEKRLNERLNQLQSIESQLGVAGGGGAGAASPASAPASEPAAGGGGALAAGDAPGAAQPPVDDRLAALVSLYEGMKPKAAAAVFDKLDTGTLLELAARMNPRKLSPIMAAMDPEKASRITGLMVGAQQAQKRVVVQVEQVAPSLGSLPEGAAAGATDTSQLPQIMPAP
ncbi:hypothetical protein [Pleomorphomonas sp. NRK KF1]|uniref:hypothetical protein n=1 Tax=Pleomorphomonas sp. NRK KF1 TaxID=2943000 RepID=UPI002042D2FF|nr:hypothetical protein [Pleomorphomonas sp. NRK KF1]MCM5555650.1 hypothetical protein [Pleomorphomonas sp. NRK KF1]